MPSAMGTNVAGGPLRVDAARACPAALASERMLAQCAQVVAGLDDRAYCAPSKVLPGGTIGKHVRHVLDHFAAALAAIERPEAVIDYDHRLREVPEETSRSAAARRVEAIRHLLARVDACAADKPVRVAVMLAADGTCAVLGSTLAREVAFAAHHAVHHYAMIGALCREQGVSVPESFGKAPATMQHERGG